MSSLSKKTFFDKLMERNMNTNDLKEYMYDVENRLLKLEREMQFNFKRMAK